LALTHHPSLSRNPATQMAPLNPIFIRYCKYAPSLKKSQLCGVTITSSDTI
jgi:hypothetical protein